MTASDRMNDFAGSLADLVRDLSEQEVIWFLAGAREQADAWLAQRSAR